MKRVVGTMMLMLFGALIVTAQNSPQATPEFKRNKQVFEMASAFNDPAVARAALYNMIAIDNGNPALLDSLALLYYEFQNFASAAIVSQAALRLVPDNPLMLELSAICYESLGLPDRALAQYESLYMKDSNPLTLYKMAFLQMQVKHYVEVFASADILLAKPELKETKIVFPKSDETTQEVSMHAALYNLKGLAAKAQGDTETAKAMFNKALEVSPDFEIALNNVQGLMTK